MRITPRGKMVLGILMMMPAILFYFFFPLFPSHIF